MEMKQLLTRYAVRCLVFEDPAEFSNHVLPTHEHVMLKYRFVIAILIHLLQN